MKYSTKLIAGVASIPFVVACSGSMDANSSTAEQPAHAAALETEARRSGRIDPTQGKPGAPVVLEYSLPAQIDSGETVDVMLHFQTRTQAGSLEVNLNAGQGIALLSQNSAEFDLATSQSPTLVANVATGTIGLFYLNIQVVETTPDGRSNARAFAVPVQVGNGQAKSTMNGVLETDSSGRKVIVMPAEE